MLKYLLIIFVIALALAPLAHFVPSKRQRAIARMREYAAVHGLFVEFREVPGGERAAALSRDVRGRLIYYGKRLPGASQEPPRPCSWLYSAEGWSSVDRRRPVPDVLEKLPPDVLAASVDEYSCGVYWAESSGEEGAEQIRQALEHWTEQIMG